MIIRYLAALACGARPDRMEIADEPLDDVLAAAGRLGLVSLLANDLAEADHPERKRAVAISLLLAAQRERLFELLRRLVEAGGLGEPILVKGGGLVLGSHLEHRDMVDLDVVVPESAVPSWQDAAANIGVDWKQGAGYEAGTISCEDGIIEVHTALPGFAGSDPGPNYGLLAPHTTSSSLPDILVPLPHAAREIAAQHFAFHHAGDVGHALRVLQDLAALEGEPEGKGLDWGRSDVATCTNRLRGIVRQIRDRRDHEPPANGYLDALEGVIDIESRMTFSEEATRWIQEKPGLGSKTRLVVRRILPPLKEIRRTPDEALARTLLRYLTRPFQLAGKLIGSRRAPDPTRDMWREEVKRLTARTTNSS